MICPFGSIRPSIIRLAETQPRFLERTAKSRAMVRLSNKKNTFLAVGEGVITQNFPVAKEKDGSVFENSMGYKYSLGLEKQGGIFNYGSYRNVTSPVY